MNVVNWSLFIVFELHELNHSNFNRMPLIFQYEFDNKDIRKVDNCTI